MKKQNYKIFLIGTIIFLQVSGCKNAESDSFSNRNSIEISSEVTDISSEENMEIDYTANEDGTYTCGGRVYDYKLTLIGKANSTAEESQFIVLTNNKTLSFDDVFNCLISSSAKVGEPEFILLGIGSL